MVVPFRVLLPPPVCRSAAGKPVYRRSGVPKVDVILAPHPDHFDAVAAYGL
jgi:hypothetical protein